MGVTSCRDPAKKKKKNYTTRRTGLQPAGPQLRGLLPQARHPGSKAPSKNRALPEPRGRHRRQWGLLTRPFRAAIMISRSSPVACSSSVGTPPERRHTDYVLERSRRANATRRPLPEALRGSLCIPGPHRSTAESRTPSLPTFQPTLRSAQGGRGAGTPAGDPCTPTPPQGHP